MKKGLTGSEKMSPAGPDSLENAQRRLLFL